MKDILLAIKEWIIYKLSIKEKECPQCNTLQMWLDREIEEKEALREVLYVNARLVVHEAEGTKEFQSVRTHTSLRVRIKMAEAAAREKMKKELNKVN